jgi:hypothetical protein
MDDAIATVDTSVETPADETVDLSTAENGGEGSPEDGGTDSANAGELGEADAAARAAGDESPIVDGKRLSEAAKATLAEIKAKDPRLAAQIKSALFSADAMKRALPGGLKEVTEIRRQIEELGGNEGIQVLRTSAQELQAIDKQLTEGDPRLIEKIAAESPEAFATMAPAAFAKFSQTHPEAYSAYVSKVFVSDMMQEGIPLALERLQDFIGENPKAQELWNKIAGYVNRVNTFAQKPVNAPAKPKEAQPDDRERQLTEREQNLTRTEWRGSADAERLKVFNSEFARLTAGRKLTDTQAAAVKELYVSRLLKGLRAAPNFNQNIDRFFASKDQAGYLRYIGSIYKQEIPKALRGAVDAVLPSKPGPKPAATSAQATAKPGTAAANPANGYAWTPSAPAKDKIDFRSTSADMIRQGKAVLLDGKKVQWKK